MALKLGPITIGSKFAEDQAKQSAGRQSQYAQAVGGMAGQAGNLYGQIVPQVAQRLQSELDNTPGYFAKRYAQQRQDVTQGIERGMGSALVGLMNRGVGNSSLTGNVMSGVARQGAEALARLVPEMEQAQDQRRMQFLQALMSLGIGQGNMAMGGYGQAGGMEGQAGDQWGQAAAQSMQPFNSLMSLLGYVGGSAVGANPALLGQGASAVGGGLNSGWNALSGLFSGGGSSGAPALTAPAPPSVMGGFAPGQAASSYWSNWPAPAANPGYSSLFQR